MARLLVLFVICATFGLGANPHSAMAQDAAKCASLKNTLLEALTDAPTAIVTAGVIAAGGGGAHRPNSYNGTPLANLTMKAETDIPGYCRVTGVVAPDIEFQLRLPVADWNGRFLMQGCGGMCGIVSMESCDDALVRNFAVVNTDMGHEGDASTTGWATDVLRTKVDFGYRATHVVTLAAKQLVKEFYGRPADHSYFRGCSTGGRQALIEAERFPEDYDGIIAGAPPLDEDGDGVFHLIWSARATVDANGKSIFDWRKLAMLHKAALKACNGDPEGVIENPAACHFDPATAECKGANGPDCLTSAEVGAARKIYAGAYDSHGKRLFPGGMQPGSEMEWVPLFVGVNGTYHGWVSDGTPIWLTEKVALLVRRVMLYRDPGPSFSLLKLNFDTFEDRLRLVEPIYDARNPDLRAFRNDGGKLIMFHGWNDAEVPTNQSIDYYSMVTGAMGGRIATEKFARLFLIPGMAHCRRGNGADTTDYLTAIENWVEKGTAPDKLISYHLKTPQNYMGLPAIRYPLNPHDYDWSRPVYPYPLVATWSGQGNQRDAATWRSQ
jgi:hypothetical protein